MYSIIQNTPFCLQTNWRSLTSQTDSIMKSIRSLVALNPCSFDLRQETTQLQICRQWQIRPTVCNHTAEWQIIANLPHLPLGKWVQVGKIIANKLGGSGKSGKQYSAERVPPCLRELTGKRQGCFPRSPPQAEPSLLTSTRERLGFLRTLHEPPENLSRAGSVLKVNWERSQTLVNWVRSEGGLNSSTARCVQLFTSEEGLRTWCAATRQDSNGADEHSEHVYSTSHELYNEEGALDVCGSTNDSECEERHTGSGGCI
ncbi:hypothetical protein BDV93DRAFT_514386 [Ceratobasidium sp. AG-I]|nr:hypothetical protein BDV93DRAFT_514386 [Ceratobasidium sp. AG-I]